MPTVIRKMYTEESEEELLEMTRTEITEGLSDKEQLFCEFYITAHNIKMSAIKAGYSKNTSHIIGYKLRRKPLVNRYIAWLKLQVSKVCSIEAMDVVEKYTRIAYADITDFLIKENGRLKLRDLSEIDGQLIRKVRQNRDGITIELYDKLSALEKLERYFDVMPADWHEKIEIQKVELLRQRLEIERVKAGGNAPEETDDGFIEALKDSAKEVWSDKEIDIDLGGEYNG
jgi:phage terminase small subunit